MFIQLAPIRLKPGIDRKALLAASERFQETFVSKQQGILKRLLLQGANNSYADLVFFRSKADAERVAKIEENSLECLEFFQIMEAPDGNLPNMGILSFEHIKTYE